MTEDLNSTQKIKKKFCSSMPLIGDKAPSFSADTTKGKINFPEDYRGKWVILFSHPADFTPVCTSELFTFAQMTEDFRRLNTELVGLSVDSVSSHLAWLKSIEEEVRFKEQHNVHIDYPVIADIKMTVAKKYGMIHPAASDTKAVRAVFFIDPESVIRAILYYPLTTGRNFQELKRLLMALQTTDEHHVSTPADWHPGDAVVVPAPTTLSGIKEAAENPQSGAECSTWYFCTKHL